MMTKPNTAQQFCWIHIAQNISENSVQEAITVGVMFFKNPWNSDTVMQKVITFMEKLGLRESKALKTWNDGNMPLIKTKTFVWVFIWMRLVLLAESCQGYRMMQNA